jgi:Na+-driven multidrug efflux pump
MAISTAPDRSGHPAHHSQPVMIAVLIAVLVLAVIGVAVLVHGGSSNPGVQGSGVAVTQTRAMARFTGLDLTGSNDAASSAVAVRADRALVAARNIMRMARCCPAPR